MIAMKKKMNFLRRKWQDLGILREFQIRVGINTGYCTVGNFGSLSRMDYTLIGGSVNFATQICKRARPDEILVSSETHALVVDRIECRPQEKVILKGRGNSVQTFEVLGSKKLDGRNSNERLTKEENGLYIGIDFDKIQREDAIRVLREVRGKLQLLTGRKAS